MRITFEMSHKEIVEVLQDYIKTKVEGHVNEVRLVVRSKQNYKAKWEPCETLILNDEAIKIAIENGKMPELAACVEVFK